MAPKLIPEISINPLVEYIGASERRRRSIIKQQKYPSDFITARYRTARAAFAKYFQNGFDTQVLISAIERLQSKTQTSDWTRNDTRNSIRALRNFLELQFPFKNLKCRFGKPATKAYLINGVAVKVAPDLLLEWELNGQRFMGAIKFYIKQKALTYEQGHINTSLLADFLRNTVTTKGVLISKQHCLCIDVMGQRIFSAPANIKDDMSLISDACDEIRRAWLAA